jgi:hypothetical protein
LSDIKLDGGPSVSVSSNGTVGVGGDSSTSVHEVQGEGIWSKSMSQLGLGMWVCLFGLDRGLDGGLVLVFWGFSRVVFGELLS